MPHFAGIFAMISPAMVSLQMKLLDYKRRIIRAEYLPFPEAVKRMCAALYGPEWTDNPLTAWLPSSLQRDPETKATIVKRWTVSKGGKEYKISSVRLKVPKSQLADFKQLKAKHREVEKQLLAHISNGTLKGILALPYHPYRIVDQAIENVLRAQSDIVFCTSYAGIWTENGFYYGMVLLPELAIEKMIKTATTPYTSYSYLKRTPDVEAAYRQLIDRLNQFSLARLRRSGGVKKPQFIVQDFSFEQTGKLLRAISGNQQFERSDLSPDAKRALLRKLFSSSELFSKAQGGRANSARREVASKILNAFRSEQLKVVDQDDDLSEESETSE